MDDIGERGGDGLLVLQVPLHALLVCHQDPRLRPARLDPTDHLVKKIVFFLILTFVRPGCGSRWRCLSRSPE